MYCSSFCEQLPDRQPYTNYSTSDVSILFPVWISDYFLSLLNPFSTIGVIFKHYLVSSISKLINGDVISCSIHVGFKLIPIAIITFLFRIFAYCFPMLSPLLSPITLILFFYVFAWPIVQSFGSIWILLVLLGCHYAVSLLVYYLDDRIKWYSVNYNYSYPHANRHFYNAFERRGQRFNSRWIVLFIIYPIIMVILTICIANGIQNDIYEELFVFIVTLKENFRELNF